MKRVSLLGGVLLSSFLGVSLGPATNIAVPSQDLPGGARAAQKPHTIGIELYRNLVFLPVRVNGSEPLTFVLDTGAGLSVLNETRAVEVGIQLQDADFDKLASGEHTQRVPTVGGLTLEVDGVRIHPKDVAIIPLGEMESYLGHRVDGVLGADLFRAFVTEIDYSGHRLILHDSADYQYSGPGAIVPTINFSGVPFVRATIYPLGMDPIRGRFLVDTGSVGALVLGAGLVQRHGLVDGKQDFLERTSYGVGGESKKLVGRIEELRIGPFSLNQLVTEFSQATGGVLGGIAGIGIIGNEILQRFRLIVDYRRSRMILEPNSDLEKPFETDMTGLLLISEGPNWEQIRIERVFEDSPAARSGLRAGDLILAIDDRTAGQFTVETLMQLFKQPGRTHRMHVKRGEQTLQIRLATMRLI